MFTFVYLCGHEALPGETGAKDFIKLTGALLGRTNKETAAIISQLEYIKPGQLNLPVCKLKNFQKGELLLSLLFYKKRPVYLIADTLFRMPIEIIAKFNEQMEKLAADGACVIYLRADLEYYISIFKTNPLINKSENWHNFLKSKIAFNEKQKTSASRKNKKESK